MAASPRNQPGPPGDFVGPWYVRWPGDPLPALPPLPGFTAAPAEDDRTLAALAGVELAEVAARRRAGNRPYLARLDGEPVALGWSTGTAVEIGELDLAFTLPPGNRYLWGFVTAPAWRGRGLYPRLLQAILRAEGADIRAWIGHEPGNTASARGILRAGFRCVGHVFRTPAGIFVVTPTGPIERARAGAALLGATLHGENESSRLGTAPAARSWLE
jgi:GNAT superfamily N-acetyltransferase